MYNYKGLTVSWKTQNCERNLREKILPFRGLAFEVIDNYGNKIDEFDGAYGIDLKADENAIKGYIRNVPSQEKWTQKSFKKRNESQYFVGLRKPTAFIPRSEERR